MILATGAIYILLVASALYIVSQLTDPSSIEGSNTRFYVALALAGGIVVVAILQFCWNMYISNPVGGGSAAILIVVVACLTGMVLKFLTNFALLE